MTLQQALRRRVAPGGKARRTGSGDLTGPLDLSQNDELGLLAREMNLMCARLAEARSRLEGETSARIAAFEQLRHADHLTPVGKLASGIAHDLGTPLNVVAGRAKLITRESCRRHRNRNRKVDHEALAPERTRLFDRRPGERRRPE